jgi:hypothetical protein
VINFSETSTSNNAGLFVPDLPLPAESEGLSRDHFVIVGHINVEHSGGDLTLGIHSNDGFGLRFIGGEFSEPYGNNGSIDGAFPSNLVFLANTTDSDTRAVLRSLPAGIYTLEFVSWERSADAFFEVYAAQGDHEFDFSTTTWGLVGDPSGPLPARAVPDSDRDGMR